MPIVSFPKAESEGISSSQTKAGSSAIADNMALAEHIGKFATGVIVTKYANENLSTMVDLNKVAISISWG